MAAFTKNCITAFAIFRAQHRHKVTVGLVESNGSLHTELYNCSTRFKL